MAYRVKTKVEEVGTLLPNLRDRDLEILLSNIFKEGGRVSSATDNTITDSSKNWIDDIWAGSYVKIIEGTGKGQIRKITTNDENTITVDVGWSPKPDNDSYYVIISTREEIKNLLNSIDETLSEIKTQTDKLTFDADDQVKVAANAEKLTASIVSDTVVAAGSSLSETVSVPTGKTGMAIQMRVTYAATAANGAVLNIYYSVDGVNFDTHTDQTKSHPLVAGDTVQKTYIVPVVTPFAKIEVVNNDGNDITVSVDITYI